MFDNLLLRSRAGGGGETGKQLARLEKTPKSAFESQQARRICYQSICDLSRDDESSLLWMSSTEIEFAAQLFFVLFVFDSQPTRLFKPFTETFQSCSVLSSISQNPTRDCVVPINRGSWHREGSRRLMRLDRLMSTRACCVIVLGLTVAVCCVYV